VSARIGRLGDDQGVEALRQTGASPKRRRLAAALRRRCGTRLVLRGRPSGGPSPRGSAAQVFSCARAAPAT